MLKRKFGIILGTMVVFSVVSAALIAAFGRKIPERGTDQKTIVTSFYPVYVITENLTKDMADVRIVNLTENHTGCLHDYQLTTKDMLLLETADIFVINGGDMELFATAAVENFVDLPVIDSCSGMQFLAGGGHTHEHKEADTGLYAQKDSNERGEKTGTQADAAARGEKADLHDDHAENVNGHVWLDMERYLQQVHAVAEGLGVQMPEYELQFRANEKAYCSKIAALQREYADLVEQLSGTEVITFHDAFVYLCDSFGMEVIHKIDLDADSALSAGEIAEITDEIKLHHIRYLFAERATGALAEQIAAQTGALVIYLDPLTDGERDFDAYLAAMRENLDALREIVCY